MQACAQDSLVIVTNSGEGGKLPSVEDRGQELNGSSYPSLGNGPHAPGICHITHHKLERIYLLWQKAKTSRVLATLGPSAASGIAESALQR